WSSDVCSSDLQNFIGRVCQVMFAQGFANIYAARRQESICHAAADDEVIDFLDHLPQNVELAGNLCTSYNRDYRMFRFAQSLVQRAKLPLHRTSSIGREIVSQKI